MSFDTLDTPAPDERSGTTDHAGSAGCPAPMATEPVWQPSTRYSDQPMSLQTRLFGTGGVAFIGLLIVGGALFTWTTYRIAQGRGLNVP
ncbi:hypothetical protein [Sphingobium cloacae]|uniref:hypothetical protein n=1 Tax=Sphingobium cloacae TaxID=120107 RepID=UPI000B2AD92F|nr:hypothetical protein [Sphingobium cloacae]